jgi:thioesterase domain-containing protein
LEEEASRLSEEILLFSPDQQIVAIVRWLTEKKYLRNDIPEADLVGYLSTFQTHIRLIENFRPAVLQAPLFIWRARESLNETSHSDETWAAHTRQSVLDQTLEGAHFTVMRPPAVATLAGELAAALSSVRAS